MTTDEAKSTNDFASNSTYEPPQGGKPEPATHDHADAPAFNRRAVLKAASAGTVGLIAFADAVAAQEQDYEPEIVMQNSFENGMVLARPEGGLPPAEAIDVSPGEGGPRGELGMEIAEAVGGIAETEVAVRKRKLYRADEARTVESVVVSDRTPPEAAEAPGEQQLQRIQGQGTFEDLGQQITGALDRQVEQLDNETVFQSSRVPGRGFESFPEPVRGEVAEVVSERLETRFESIASGFVAEPTSATTRPLQEERESQVPAYGGRTADYRQDWCVRICASFCPWWLRSLCEYYCDFICDGLCWIIDWFTDYFNIAGWEESLLREYAGC